MHEITQLWGMCIIGKEEEKDKTNVKISDMKLTNFWPYIFSIIVNNAMQYWKCQIGHKYNLIKCKQKPTCSASLIDIWIVIKRKFASCRTMTYQNVIILLTEPNQHCDCTMYKYMKPSLKLTDWHFIGSHAASFKRTLLSVDVSVCLCICVDTSMLDISKTKRFNRLSNRDPIGKCLRHVDWWSHWWCHVTITSYFWDRATAIPTSVLTAAVTTTNLGQPHRYGFQSSRFTLVCNTA